MKVLIQPGAAIIVMMIMTNSRANVPFEPLNNLFPAVQSCTVANQAVVTSGMKDSLVRLQENYPLVYNHILNEFKDASSLNYAVEGNTLLVSFTSNNHKILAVYSTSGEFRHSIANIGLALPNVVTETLKTEYPAYTVYYGKEIRANDKKLYEVVIENKYEYRLINFVDAEMIEVKKLKK